MQKRQEKELLGRLAPLKGKKVLDLGGGTGSFAAKMSAAGADVWLLDASSRMLQQAAKVLPSERVIWGDAVNMPFCHNSFDIIILVDVLHHFRNQEDALKECYRTLLPGGSLWLLEFSPDHLLVRLLAGLERLSGEPSRFVSPEELDGLLKRTGFSQIKWEYTLAYEYVTQAKKPL